MLPALARMRRGAEFTATVRRGRRGSSRAVTVHMLTTDASSDALGADPARVGFVVSRAVGPAVVRNRVRRRLRHLVGARLAQLPAGALVVVRALPDAARLSSTELAAELDRALARTRDRAAGGGRGRAGVPSAYAAVVAGPA